MNHNSIIVYISILLLIVFCIFGVKYFRGCTENRIIFNDFTDQVMTRVEDSDKRYLELIKTRFVDDEPYCSKTHDKIKNLVVTANQKLQKIENRKGVCWFNRGDLECQTVDGHVTRI